MNAEGESRGTEVSNERVTTKKVYKHVRFQMYGTRLERPSNVNEFYQTEATTKSL